MCVALFGAFGETEATNFRTEAQFGNKSERKMNAQKPVPESLMIMGVAEALL